MQIHTAVANLAVGVFVAVTTAVITVRLALKRFYAESWWTRKYDAYHAVLESLHHIREHATTNLAFADRPRGPNDAEMPAEGEKKLTEQMQAATAELRKQFDIGGFLLCSEAIAALKRLMLKLEESTASGDWIQNLKLRRDAVDECLGHMRGIAAVDLKVPSS